MTFLHKPFKAPREVAAAAAAVAVTVHKTMGRFCSESRPFRSGLLTLAGFTQHVKPWLH